MLTNGAGRTAFVTGGARGIGAAIARGLAEDGLAVVVADMRLQQARDTVAEIEAAGGAGLAVELDVTDPPAVSTAVDAAVDRFGQINVLVNNAGWDELKPFLETDEEFWDRVIDVNFKGALRLTRAILPEMVERGWGRIVNIGSDAGRVGSSLESVYSGAKGAIIAFTKTLAREVARSGVTANVVCPGPTDTPFLRETAAKQKDADAVLTSMTRGVPMRRLGQPDEVAAAVRFFADASAGYITGQTLSVSGGLTMA
jgi:2-hydroxycyclohexanecarboxyl-CoA dehydrogenase